MAAKQQGKKKAKTGKRKQLQKSHRQRQRQKNKQKKPWNRHAHKGKAGVRPKPCLSKLFASKMLRQMPKVRMEAKARRLVKTLLTRLYKQVAIEVRSLEKRSENNNVSGTEVQTALNDAMAKLLAKHKPKPTDPVDPLASSQQCA